jgi:hypothetical protein
MTDQESASDRSSATDEKVVFSTLRDSCCAECGTALFSGSLLILEKERPLCLACAELDHLVYLARGDTALTRRSRKYSSQSIVVVRFSRARGRYERQGVLVEAAALERAEVECHADGPAREQARIRAAAVREAAESRFQAEFAARISNQYPGCPRDTALRITRHACEKYSGRVGRSAAAREFDTGTVDLAVRAHIRHALTDYDRLLRQGWERADARAAVAAQVDGVAAKWRRADEA